MWQCRSDHKVQSLSAFYVLAAIIVVTGFAVTFSLFYDSAPQHLLFAPLIDGSPIKVIEKD